MEYRILTHHQNLRELRTQLLRQKNVTSAQQNYPALAPPAQIPGSPELGCQNRREEEKEGEAEKKKPPIPRHPPLAGIPAVGGRRRRGSRRGPGRREEWRGTTTTASSSAVEEEEVEGNVQRHGSERDLIGGRRNPRQEGKGGLGEKREGMPRLHAWFLRRPLSLLLLLAVRRIPLVVCLRPIGIFLHVLATVAARDNEDWVGSLSEKDQFVFARNNAGRFGGSQDL